MLAVPTVIGVKNSSMPIQDIEMWRDEGAIVFNGPDEQLLSGLAAGAVGGIGGTYAAMPELYERIFTLVRGGGILPARDIQDACCHIIYKMCSGQGNMYAMIKGDPPSSRRAGYRRRPRAALPAAAGRQGHRRFVRRGYRRRDSAVLLLTFLLFPHAKIGSPVSNG